MRLDFSQCKTPEDVERVLKPLGPLMRAVRTHFDPAEQAYRDGAVHGLLIMVARKARVAWGSGDVTVMTQALGKLSAAERLAGVDLTSPTEEDLAEAKPRRKRSSKDRRDPQRIARKKGRAS